jgi:hypothetical protein
MNDSFGKFSLEIDQFIKDEVPARLNQFKRAIALHILRGVIKKSPVDTGRFRNNWHVGINQSPEATDSPADKSGAMAAAGSQVIASAKPGETIWISNNLPYAGALENGHSGQAASGVLGVTIAEVQAGIVKGT